MFKFLKLLFMGVKDTVLDWIPATFLFLPGIIGISIGLLLNSFISSTASTIITVTITLIGYWLSEVLPHCKDAIIHHKKYNVSLKEAWKKTYVKEILPGY